MARILIVEDEMLVAMLLEDVVAELGHEVAGLAMRLETAVEAVEREDFDFAILDINLAGKHSYPVADRLRLRGIPFIFASGYGAAGLSKAYQDTLVLRKPFDIGQVARALEDFQTDAGNAALS